MNNDRDKVIQEARELLARQYDRDDPTMAKKIREGTCRNEEANRAIPAIIAALTRQKAQQEAQGAVACECEAAQVCGEAYQVVGCLLSDTGMFDTEHGEKILDNLSQARLVHKDVLPWHHKSATPPAPVDVLALRALLERMAAHVRPTCSELYDEARALLDGQPAGGSA